MYVARAPSVAGLLNKLDPQVVMTALTAPADVLPRDKYLHWDKLKRLDPPGDLTDEQWWLKIKMARSDDLRQLPLTDVRRQSIRLLAAGHMSSGTCTTSTSAAAARWPWTRS